MDNYNKGIRQIMNSQIFTQTAAISQNQIFINAILITYGIMATITIPLTYASVKGWFPEFKINKKKTKLMLIPIIKNVLFNELFITVPSLWLVSNYVSCEYNGRINIIFQIIVMMLITETWFYHIHKIFHSNKFLYKNVHKYHHRWHNPVALSATDSHPIEHAFANILALSLGIITVNCNVILFWIMVGFSTVNSSIVHSGYYFPLMSCPMDHDHHHSKNKNKYYGMIGIFDKIYGTNVLNMKDTMSKENPWNKLKFITTKLGIPLQYMKYITIQNILTCYILFGRFDHYSVI